MIFAWDQKNRDHIAEHGVVPEEAQHVVENAAPPFPQDVGDGKRRVWGATPVGRWLQVIYVLKNQNELTYDLISVLDWAVLKESPKVKVVRVIHAMDLTADMKRQLRRRRR